MNLTNTTLAKTWNSKSLSIVALAYIVICLVAAAQGLFGTPKVYIPGGNAYTDYNNYIIFKNSFFHLIHRQDLYQLYPAEQWDLYKYSPAFSLLFAPFAWMPDAAGLILWNLLNAFCLFAGVRMLPGLDDRRKSRILLFCLLELLLSLQNSQSNGIMAGLILLAFSLAERSKFALSTLCIVLSVYIKLFGGLAFVFFLFYPGKLRAIGWSLLWMVLFSLLPLLVIDARQLNFLYHSWLKLLQNDHNTLIGLSVMGLLESWLHWEPSKNAVTLTGLLLFLLPLIYIRKYKDYYFRVFYLASVLLWIVIFNHKAESPTFIIAMAGIGIWYFYQEKNTLNLVLLLLSLFLVSLSVSDLVPSSIRSGIVKPYVIKGLMPVVIWAKLLYEQLTLRYQPERLI